MLYSEIDLSPQAESEVMEMQTPIQPSTYEQAVIRIMRKLPLERIKQLVDFARFLETQATQEYNEGLDEEEIETTEEIRSDEETWDELLAKPKAKQMMRKMAREALEDYRAGRTTDVAITEDGRLTPA